ncbi:Gfo/Idh/MocA family oxidoreductase [Vallitalea sediminicola]
MNKRICVIGAGRWGKNHIRTLNEMGNLGGIVESDNIILNQFLSKYNGVEGYAKMEDSFVDDYDGYVLATPADTHFKIGKLILEAKKNVLIEKPIALTSREVRVLIDLSKENHCQLMVGHLLLFHPAIIKLKQLINNGKIGKILYLYTTRLNFGTVRTRENVCFSLAPHDISILNYLMDELPTDIEAVGSCLLQKNIPDIVIANFTYESEIDAHVFVSWLHPFKEQRIIAIGDKGMLYFSDSGMDKNIYYYDKIIKWENGKPIKCDEGTEVIEYDKAEPLKNELEYFIKSIDDPQLKIADGKSGLEVIEILEEITNKVSCNIEKEVEENE